MVLFLFFLKGGGGRVLLSGNSGLLQERAFPQDHHYYYVQWSPESKEEKLIIVLPPGEGGREEKIIKARGRLPIICPRASCRQRLGWGKVGTDTVNFGLPKKGPEKKSPNSTYWSSDGSLVSAVGSSRSQPAFARSAANASQRWIRACRAATAHHPPAGEPSPARAVARTSGRRG